MATRWARFVRGWVAAVFATLVAVVLHTFGGGAVPGIVAIALSLAFASLACIALSGKTLSAWRLAAAVGFSQFLFHGIFSTLGTASPATSAPVHLHGVVPLLAAASPATHAESWMLPAHLAAAILTFLRLTLRRAGILGTANHGEVVPRHAPSCDSHRFESSSFLPAALASTDPGASRTRSIPDGTALPRPARDEPARLSASSRIDAPASREQSTSLTFRAAIRGPRLGIP